uniref:Uncharacterized protein n=1 Tax=Timema bartmani TaxID=61472 RepID=A0A7R9HXY5_9NEOP|nr:unnamed protein product [Timema bartmani]
MTGNQGGKPSGIPKEQRFAHFYKPREVSLLLGNLLKENIFTAQVQSTRGSRFTVVQPTRLVSFSLGSEKVPKDYVKNLAETGQGEVKAAAEAVMNKFEDQGAKLGISI